MKDLSNSDKTRIDPTLLPVLNLRVLEIVALYTLNGTYLILFLREKANEEIGYNCNHLFMTPIKVYNPFCIIDFLSRCCLDFETKSAIFANFLSLTDCLITPKREG